MYLFQGRFMISIIFLSVDDAIRIHERVIARDGGLAGTRDIGLLTSAIMVPQQGFGGQFLHEDLAAMGAAYLFHLAKNHAFLDGNKRVALAAALTFLVANGAESLPEQDEAADVTLAVAAGQMTKEALTTWFRTVLTRAGPASE